MQYLYPKTHFNSELPFTFIAPDKGVEMIPQFIMEIAGWLPGVIFPAGTGLQFYKIWRGGTAKGVSISTWLLFAVANIGLYIYAQKYDSLQMIVGLLGTATLDAAIVVLVLARRDKKEIERSHRA